MKDTCVLDDLLGGPDSVMLDVLSGSLACDLVESGGITIAS